jgi:hypothetical protein
MIVYFFCGSHFIQVTREETGPGSSSAIQPISDWGWPKFANSHRRFGADGIDAALYSGSYSYFFKGPYYIKVIRHGTTGFGTLDTDFTYPRPISDWGWRKLPNGEVFGAKGIDAALWSGPVCYFFSGNYYTRVTRSQSDFGNGGDPYYPKTISAGWGWSAPFSNGVKGALPSGQKCYFFSCKEYIRVSRGLELAGFIDPNYPADITAWDFPKGFGQNGIDAALYSGGDLQPQPTGGLTGNVNYWLGSSGANLTNVSVTINIDNDLISTADGFGFQLNAMSEWVPSTARAVVQQIIIFSDRNTNDLKARLYIFFSANSPTFSMTEAIDLQKTLATLPGVNHLPAGSSVNFAVQNDKSTGKVTGCIFTYTPPKGSGSPTSVCLYLSDAKLATTGKPPTLDDMSPIDTFTMDIVADYSYPNAPGVAKLTEAQGTITYSATPPLTANTNTPSYSDLTSITEETANIIYAALPANRAIDVSQLFGTTPPVPVDLEDDEKPKFKISHRLQPPPALQDQQVLQIHSHTLPQPPY